MNRKMYRNLVSTDSRRNALKLLGGSFLGGFAVAAGLSASAAPPPAPGREIAASRTARETGEIFDGTLRDLNATVNSTSVDDSTPH